MGSTGDLLGNIAQLQRDLRQLKYQGELDEVGLRLGDPVASLPLLHFSLLKFSRHVARVIAANGHELLGKSDQRFVENAYKLFREDGFNIRPTLTAAQFLEMGFAERRVLLLIEVLQACKRIHNEEARKERLATAKPRSPVVQVHPLADAALRLRRKSVTDATVRVVRHCCPVLPADAQPGQPGDHAASATSDQALQSPRSKRSSAPGALAEHRRAEEASHTAADAPLVAGPDARPNNDALATTQQDVGPAFLPAGLPQPPLPGQPCPAPPLPVDEGTCRAILPLPLPPPLRGPAIYSSPEPKAQPQPAWFASALAAGQHSQGVDSPSAATAAAAVTRPGSQPSTVATAQPYSPAVRPAAKQPDPAGGPSYNAQAASMLSVDALMAKYLAMAKQPQSAAGQLVSAAAGAASTPQMPGSGAAAAPNVPVVEMALPLPLPSQALAAAACRLPAADQDATAAGSQPADAKGPQAAPPAVSSHVSAECGPTSCSSPESSGVTGASGLLTPAAGTHNGTSGVSAQAPALLQRHQTLSVAGCEGGNHNAVLAARVTVLEGRVRFLEARLQQALEVGGSQLLPAPLQGTPQPALLPAPQRMAPPASSSVMHSLPAPGVQQLQQQQGQSHAAQHEQAAPRAPTAPAVRALADSTNMEHGKQAAVASSKLAVPSSTHSLISRLASRYDEAGEFLKQLRVAGKADTASAGC